MAKFDLKAGGWTTIFSQHATQVVLPEELSKKWWDKKKQVTAKMSRATGVGASLDELAKDFRPLVWPTLPGNPVVFEKGVQDCRAFMTSGALKKFRATLKDVRELAVAESKELKKSLLTKKTGEVLDEMAKIAQSILDASNSNSLSGSLDAAVAEWGKAQRASAIKNAGPTLKAVGMVIQKTPAKLKVIDTHLQTFQEDDEAMVGEKGKEVTIRGALGNAIRDLCRDCTQPLGNLMKSHKAGVMFVDFDGPAIAQLAKDMSRISNTNGTEFMNGLSGAKAADLVKQVKAWTRTFDDLLANVEIGVVPDV